MVIAEVRIGKVNHLRKPATSHYSCICKPRSRSANCRSVENLVFVRNSRCYEEMSTDCRQTLGLGFSCSSRKEEGSQGHCFEYTKLFDVQENLH